jgi:Family of unknown function (DUF5825)
MCRRGSRLPTGDRTGVQSGAVLELDEPGASLDLDVAAAVRGGVRAVRLRGTCRLAANEPRATLALIRLLRDAASHGVPVTWQARDAVGLDAGLLAHLPPPEPSADTGEDLAQWRQRHQPGLCYYRVGPDFVLVKDARRDSAPVRLRLEGVVDEFRRLEDVVDVHGLDAAAAGVLEDLEREALALRLGDLATLLPSRMRRWPVPALDV